MHFQIPTKPSHNEAVIALLFFDKIHWTYSIRLYVADASTRRTDEFRTHRKTFPGTYQISGLWSDLDNCRIRIMVGSGLLSDPDYGRIWIIVESGLWSDLDNCRIRIMVGSGL